MTGQLPASGDVRRAADAMNKRVEAALNVPQGTRPGFVDIGLTTVDGTGIGGVGADAMRRVHGDLVDTGEFIDDVALGWINATLDGVTSGKFDPISALASLSIQSVALGVLMERQRWEAKP